MTTVTMQSSFLGSAFARRPLCLGTLAIALSTAGAAAAQQPGAPDRELPRDTTPRIELYGFGQGDAIYDFKRNDPNWFDVNRPTKLPAFVREFRGNGNAWVSPRQSKFGLTAHTPTKHGDVLARFEFDMFGVGIDAGQTTIRLRLAYGQWNHFGGGQLWSQFMDIDVFPNVLDYWGPNGMIFFRNAQLFWRPIDKKDGTQLSFAIERPGASGDAGPYADRINLDNIRPHFEYPDLTAAYRWGAKWGHVKLSGIVRDIGWEQIPVDTFDISGRATGWGLSLGSAIKTSKRDVLRLQVNYGAGIQNYFNDAPVDIGVINNLGVPDRPLLGEALPIFGTMIYLDHTWNDEFTSTAGWSMVNINNSNLQLPTAFHNGQYATANVLWTPVKNVVMGAEAQYARRVNAGDEDDFDIDELRDFDGFRIQVSFRYSWSLHLGGRNDRK